jgi:hypothetical protein
VVVIVLRRHQFLERLAVGGFVDVLADRLDEDIRPVFVEEVRDRVETFDEIFRGLEMDPSRFVTRAHSMCKFCTQTDDGSDVCT